MPSLKEMVDEVAATVFRKLGPFHREHIYRRALAVELENRDLFVEEEVNIPIVYSINGRRIVLGIERADIIINQSCILELKCGNPRPAVVEAARGQASRYMRFYDTPTAKIAFTIFFGDTAAHSSIVHADALFSPMSCVASPGSSS